MVTAIFLILIFTSFLYFSFFDTNQNQFSTEKISLSDDIELKIYESTFPHIWHLADVQKGADLLFQGNSLLGEGFGFGLPLVVTNNTPFLSNNARIEKISNSEVKKVFDINLMDKSFWSDAENRYIANFSEIKSIGNIEVSFKIETNGKVLITSYFDLDVEIEFILMMNEQNSDFKQYFDSNNSYFEMLPPWNKTYSETACLTNSLQIRFCVNAPNNEMFYGSEFVQDSLDWSGIDILVNNTSSFSYYLFISSFDDRYYFFPTSEPVISSPVPVFKDSEDNWMFSIADWDGNLYLMDYTLSLSEISWKIHHSSGIFSSPTVFPCKQVSSQCIGITSEDGSIFIYNETGGLKFHHKYDIENFFWSSMVYTGKGVAFIGKYNFYYIYENGSNIEGFPQLIDDWGDSSPAFYKFENGPGLFAVGGLTQGNDSHGYLYAWWENGTSLENYPIDLGIDTDSSPAIVDIDNDSKVEIIIGDDGGKIHAFNLHGEELEGFPVIANDLIEASPSIGLDNPTGEFIIVIGSWDSYLYALDNSGNLVKGFPVKAYDQIISSAGIVDLTGDDIPEIIVGSKDFGLYIWNLSGQLLPFFPINLSASVFSSPLIMDINNNHFLDIVIGSNAGVHVILDVGVGDFKPWSMFRQNPMRTGSYL